MEEGVPEGSQHGREMNLEKSILSSSTKQLYPLLYVIRSEEAERFWLNFYFSLVFTKEGEVTAFHLLPAVHLCI